MDPDNFSPSLSDMLRPSMQTLKHIVVNFHDVDDDDDSLLRIPSEFEGMRTKNLSKLSPSEFCFGYMQISA